MKAKIVSGLAACVLLVGVFIGFNSWTTIKSGHVGVSTLFGKVQDTVLDEGFNLVNPLAIISEVDARQKTYKSSIGVPSKDQLITRFELSLQYRLIKEKAPDMKKNTGTPQDVLDVHMVPNLRSYVRELGKSVAKAEDFYQQEVQKRIQDELLAELSKLCEKGIRVEKILIRDVVLPKIITDAVQRKKEAAQAAEKAKEELRKFKVDQERKEAQALAEEKAELIDANKKKQVMLIAANAELEAARIKAKAIVVEAEALAEAKKKQIEVVGEKNYVTLEAFKSLEYFQDGNHVIMMDPNAQQVLPFMNLTK